MKKLYILITLCALCALSGCGTKSSFSTTFDEFTIKVYDNQKPYVTVPQDANSIMKVMAEMKEKTATDDTGFVNSFIIIRTPIQTGTSIRELVDSNTKDLELKLLKYKSTDNISKKVKCAGLQYSGYITAFSYQLDDQTLYVGQYFFLDEQLVYLISFSSDDYKDITSFIKSIGTIKCKQ